MVVDPDVSEVEIIDEDGVHALISDKPIITDILFISTEILVGFETVFTSAHEGNDTVELCVRIFTDVALLPTHINMSFSLDLVSVSGTAGKN